MSFVCHVSAIRHFDERSLDTNRRKHLDERRAKADSRETCQSQAITEQIPLFYLFQLFAFFLFLFFFYF